MQGECTILALREKIFSRSIYRMRKKLCSSSFLLVGLSDKGLYIVTQCSKTFDIVIIQRGFNTLLTDSVQKLRVVDTIYRKNLQCISTESTHLYLHHYPARLHYLFLAYLYPLPLLSRCPPLLPSSTLSALR